MADLADRAWQELLDKDDRTSPEECPEMCLITQDELRGFIAAAQAPAELPWDSPHNRHYEIVERAAKEIYNAFPWPYHGEKPKWFNNGNSDKQDEARDIARGQLRAVGHKPNAS